MKRQIEERVGADACWLDLSGIESDKEFVDVIIDAIKRTDVFLFVYSLSSQASLWTRKELQFAERKHKRIVFVKIDRTELSEWFEFNYGGHDIVDISVREEKEKLLSNLADWCGGSGTSNPQAERIVSNDDMHPSRIRQKKVLNGKKLLGWATLVIALLLVVVGLWRLSVSVKSVTVPVRSLSSEVSSILASYSDALKEYNANPDNFGIIEKAREKMLRLLSSEKDLSSDDFKALQEAINDLNTVTRDHYRRLNMNNTFQHADREFEKMNDMLKKGLLTRSVAEVYLNDYLGVLDSIRVANNISADNEEYLTRKRKAQLLLQP